MVDPAEPRGAALGPARDSAPDAVESRAASLQQVYDVVRARLAEADPGHSYVAALAAKGTDAVLRKIAEESTELLLAAKDGNRAATVHELTDLVFHLLVWMATEGITPGQLEQELGARFGRSGLRDPLPSTPHTP